MVCMKLKYFKIQEKYKLPINLFKDRAFSKYKDNVQKLIIYGSVARGEAKSDSDIDIFVIWKGDKLEAWHSLESIAFDVLLETGIYISLKIVTPTEHKKLLNNNNYFIKTISQEGIFIAS